MKDLGAQIQDLVANVYETARQEAWKRGYQAGYTDLRRRLIDFVAALPQGHQIGDEEEPQPDPEPASEPPLISNNAQSATLSPSLQRAYELLKESPGGITSRQGRDQWGGSSAALYRLRALGLAEKRGAKFFPTSSDAAAE